MKMTRLVNRGELQRYALSAVVACAVTAALVLVMYHAIHRDEPVVFEPAQLRLTEWRPVMEDRTPPTKDRRVPKPEPVEPEPDVPDLPSFVPQLGDGGGAGIPRPEPQPDPIAAVGNAEGDMLPIMTVPPEYPQRMLARGIEGWVIVEFTVDELGRVTEPRVVDAQPGSGFNNAALRAVQRYKYKPRVINGDAVRVTGVRQRIVFNVSA